MPTEATVVVSDAHLGHATPEAERAFHRFLETLPGRCDHLIVNGDLFEFWFEYRTVIPRTAFPTLERLAALRRRGVRLTLTGGNHDRWGGPFWREQLGSDFHADGLELELSGRRALVVHGDEVEDVRPSARVLHGMLRRGLSATLFRWLHPDVGIRLVRRFGSVLSDKHKPDHVVQAGATRQEAWARRLLARRTDLQLVVMGHTHRPALIEVEPGRWYVNPGAWLEGYRYVLVTPDGPRLAQFTD